MLLREVLEDGGERDCQVLNEFLALVRAFELYRDS